MKPLLISSGEPAGIGPDICLALAAHSLPVVIAGDRVVLTQRAKQLNLAVELVDYSTHCSLENKPGQLHLLPFKDFHPVIAGQLNVKNSAAVMAMLQTVTDRCLQGEFSALITAPVHKGIINQAQIPFSGHTEFLAQRCGVETVVMMLVCDAMRVALVTTHLPLRDVADAITKSNIMATVRQLHQSLQQDFAITKPRIWAAGLNPHAGEGGYLGREEINVIQPAIQALQTEGIDISGPFSADTLFTSKNLTQCDAFLAMYHDQGLPVLKSTGFGEAVNVTLGLPIIRTSVDHGTALDLAGSGRADHHSLLAAVNLALSMVKARGN